MNHQLQKYQSSLFYQSHAKCHQAASQPQPMLDESVNKGTTSLATSIKLSKPQLCIST